MSRKGVLFALFLFGSNIAAGVQQNWSMFQADAARSGRSEGYGPQGPEVAVLTSLQGALHLQSPIVLGPEGNLYIVMGLAEGGNYGILHAISRNGKLLWKSDARMSGNAVLFNFGLAVSNNGILYFSSRSYEWGVTAYSREGEILWSYDPPFNYSRGPHLAIGDGGVIYFNSSSISNNTGQVVALNPDGIEMWVVDSGFAANPSTIGVTLLSIDPGFAYISSFYSPTNNLRINRVALDGETPPETIRYTTGTNSGVTVDNAGDILFLSSSGLQKIDSNGDLVWQNESAACNDCDHRPVILADGATVAVIKNSDDTARIVCVNADGSTRWIHSLLETDTPGQPVADASGSVFVPIQVPLGVGDSPRLIALNPVDGALLWFFDGPTDSIISSSLALSPEGMLFAAVDRRDGFVDIYRFSDAFLSFPIPGMRPETAPITSVFDHAMDTRYCPLEFGGSSITTFLGEFGSVLDLSEPPVGPMCGGQFLYSYKKVDSSTFLEGFNYVGTTTTGPTTVNYDGHPGWDYPVCIGTPVTAAAAGTVTLADDVDDDANGKRIWIDHGDGYVTVYQHLNRLDILVGENVVRGQRIGASGNTGGVGPHLHFEVRREGVSVDPYGWRGGGEDPYALLGHTSTPSLWLTYPYGEEPIFADGFECGNLNNWSVVE